MTDDPGQTNTPVPPSHRAADSRLGTSGALDVRTLHTAIDDSVARLASPWVEESLTRDPYWPKWDSPWWHIVLLWELGAAARIPSRAVELLAKRVDAYCLHTFPLEPQEVPEGAIRFSRSCAIAASGRCIA